MSKNIYQNLRKRLKKAKKPEPDTEIPPAKKAFQKPNGNSPVETFYNKNPLDH